MKLLLLCCFISFVDLICCCNRRPQGANDEPSPVDENFQILIDGNPATYIPGQQYNISLSSAGSHRFISFTLVVESEDGALNTRDDMLGHFDIIDGAESHFSTLCANMVESTNTNPKTRIDVSWIAPTNPESTCVLIKAGLLQNRNVWFIDDGFLTKRICPEEIDEVNSQTPLIDPCCACDEAKYEILLERKWTRNTHPKDFPSESWRTRFSEIIGASHSFDYRFWEYGMSASPGLQEMAEHGSTQTLELEIKSNISSIRTIIKAPGIVYRLNANGITLANVRVDRTNHLISLVSKIIPSPDWILGAAGLELCLANCTWIEQKVLNLYPWDVGTDSGPSYMSPDEAQKPPDVVRRITSSIPSDVRSPFFDETGAPMKAMGTLYITRKKLYERECEFDDNVPLECATHPWNNWSECTARCGNGEQYRIRAYKDVGLALSYGCQAELEQKQSCVGTECGRPEDEYDVMPNMAECELGPWSEWSKCSTPCGNGYRTRTRNFINIAARSRCLSGTQLRDKQREPCEGKNCFGSVDNSPFENAGTINEQFPNFDDSNISEEYGQANRPTSFIGQRGSQGSNNQYEATWNGVNEWQGNSDYNNVMDNNHRNPNENAGAYYNEQDDTNRYPETFNQVSNRPANYRYKTTTRAPYTQTSRPNYENSPYNNYNPNDLNSQNSANAGVHEEYDENGHKSLVVNSVDPDKYNVVQDYCFQKPYPAVERCNARSVIVKNYWFYDADDLECKLFTTDNCDENKNKFGTLEACEGSCLRPLQNLQITQGTNGNDDWNNGVDLTDTQWNTRNRNQQQSNNDRNWSRGFGPSYSQTIAGQRRIMERQKNIQSMRDNLNQMEKAINPATSWHARQLVRPQQTSKNFAGNVDNRNNEFRQIAAQGSRNNKPYLPINQTSNNMRNPHQVGSALEMTGNERRRNFRQQYMRNLAQQNAETDAWNDSTASRRYSQRTSKPQQRFDQLVGNILPDEFNQQQTQALWRPNRNSNYGR